MSPALRLCAAIAAAAFIGTGVATSVTEASSPDGIVSDRAYESIVDGTNAAVREALEKFYGGNWPVPAPQEEIE